MFGMRGLDYRSRKVPMHLVIAKSFSTERDAMQGLNRVGRFGDPCSRICFTDVPLIDKAAALRARGRLAMVLAKMAKEQVAMNPVKVKPISASAPKKNVYTGRNKKRNEQLLDPKNVAPLTTTTIDTFFMQKK